MNIKGQENKTYQLYVVTMGNAKIAEKIEFHLEAPVIKYHQESYNSCCLSILAAPFHSIGDNRAVTDLENSIEESLTLKTNRFRNIINFANNITKKKLRDIGEQHLRYNIKKWKTKGDFDILNEISEMLLW